MCVESMDQRPTTSVTFPDWSSRDVAADRYWARSAGQQQPFLIWTTAFANGPLDLCPEFMSLLYDLDHSSIYGLMSSFVNFGPESVISRMLPDDSYFFWCNFTWACAVGSNICWRLEPFCGWDPRLEVHRKVTGMVPLDSLLPPFTPSHKIVPKLWNSAPFVLFLCFTFFSQLYNLLFFGGNFENFIKKTCKYSDEKISEMKKNWKWLIFEKF